VGSDLYRAATTKYPCYVPILGDSEGAGRTGLPVFAADKISASRMQRTCSLLRRSLISQSIFQKSAAKVRIFLRNHKCLAKNFAFRMIICTFAPDYDT
jgi:hypothetical protein